MRAGKQAAYKTKIGLKAKLAIQSDGDNNWLFILPSNSSVSALKEKKKDLIQLIQ